MDQNLTVQDVLNCSSERCSLVVCVNESNSTLIVTPNAAPTILALSITTQQHAINITYIILALFGIIGNLLALIVIITHSPIRKRLPNYYFINQTIVDFLVSLLLVPTVTKGLISFGYSTTPLCLIWQSRVFFLAFYMISVYGILALSVERYLEVVHPIWHKLNVTKVKVIGTIVIVWLTGFIQKFSYQLPTSGAVNGFCYIAVFYPSRTASFVAGLTNGVFDFIFPLFLISFCYIQMWRCLKNKVKPQPAGPNISVKDRKYPLGSNLSQARKNIFVTLVIIVAFFVVCNTYKQVLILLRNLYIVPLDFTSIGFNVSQIMSFVNSTIAPYVYLLHHREFKNGFRKLFVCK